MYGRKHPLWPPQSPAANGRVERLRFPMQEIAENVGTAQKETHQALERQQSKKVAAS